MLRQQLKPVRRLGAVDPRWLDYMERQRRLHKTRKATKWASRKVAKVNRKAWARRRPLAPLYGAVAVLLLGVAAHLAPDGAKSMTALAAVAAVVIACWQLWAARRPESRHAFSTAEWVYTGCVWGAVTVWLNAAAVYGVGAPRPGWLAVILVGAWVPVIVRYWIGDVPTVAYAEVKKVWAEEAAAADGLAPRSTMHQPEPLDPKDPTLAWRARIELPPRSRVMASALLDKAEAIAMVYDRPVQDIAVEVVTGKSPRWADLTVFTRNPLMDREWWPGVDQVFNPETGVILAARYVTGGRAPYRQFRASGPVHTLISGTTDAGKSGFINSLLAVERAHPYMASVVIDPQQGQSLPDWRGQVAMYAPSVVEGAEVMAAVRQEMYRRNAILSRVEWVDDQGRERRGVTAYDINSPVIRALNMPMICVTLEEAGDALLNEDIREAAITISTMARKCGIKLRLVSQVPLLDQLQSTVLRDMLVGGNVVVFRTANKLSGQVAFNGVLPADPSLLPREWEDGSTTAGLCYVLGPQAKAIVARTWPIEDTYHWSTVGETTMLPSLEALIGAAIPLPGAPEQPATAEKTKQTAGKRIVAFLAEHEMSTTGILSQRLDIPMSTVSTTCARLEEAGQIEKLNRGKWGAIAQAAEVAA